MDPAKVLVVDDERSILLLLKEALSQWGYQVTVASSAAEALGLLDQVEGDLHLRAELSGGESETHGGSLSLALGGRVYHAVSGAGGGASGSSMMKVAP